MSAQNQLSFLKLNLCAVSSCPVLVLSCCHSMLSPHRHPWKKSCWPPPPAYIRKHPPSYMKASFTNILWSVELNDRLNLLIKETFAFHAMCMQYICSSLIVCQSWKLISIICIITSLLPNSADEMSWLHKEAIKTTFLWEFFPTLF